MVFEFLERKTSPLPISVKTPFFNKGVIWIKTWDRLKTINFVSCLTRKMTLLKKAKSLLFLKKRVNLFHLLIQNKPWLTSIRGTLSWLAMKTISHDSKHSSPFPHCNREFFQRSIKIKLLHLILTQLSPFSCLILKQKTYLFFVRNDAITQWRNYAPT